MATERSCRRLQWLLGILAVWDLAIGIWAVGFAEHLQAFVRFEARAEPLFIRGVGVYWLFAAYLQFLGALNPEKNRLAVQLSIVFRLSAAVVDTVEALFLLPGPWYHFHYMLLSFVAMNLVIAYLMARWLKGMGLRWHEL